MAFLVWKDVYTHCLHSLPFTQMVFWIRNAAFCRELMEYRERLDWMEDLVRSVLKGLRYVNAWVNNHMPCYVQRTASPCSEWDC